MPHPDKNAKGLPRRKVFKFDLASHWTPETNPEPTTARGRRRRERGPLSRKPPEMLIVGLAHRPHTHPGKLNGPSIKGHIVTESHARLIPLTRTYKASSH